MIKKILENKGKKLKPTTLGFTLIELLAVIVILAIIALIATPIVLNIIEDSKDSSRKRSIDNYANAVEHSVANSQLENPTGKIAGTFTTEDGKTLTGSTTLTVDYDGDVVCDTIEVYSDGSIYLGDCKVDGESVDYTYGTFKGVPKPVSFAGDSWETIVANVKAGNLSKYNLGDTKEIELTGFTNEETDSNGLYTIRIANTSTPEECNTEGFSQTACGFVIEFADRITNHAMNSTDTNVGGWNASEMRTYVNETIYNAFPEELKESLIDTYVVSGHGSNSGETNFTTTDKLYLLSPKEVLGEVSNDTSKEQTRQLDYYKSIGVTTDNYSGAIKNNNGSASCWWLRSANYNNTNNYYSNRFYRVSEYGDSYHDFATNTYGVAVAFRI